MKTIVKSIRLTEKMLERLKAEAENLGVSVCALIRLKIEGKKITSEE